MASRTRKENRDIRHARIRKVMRGDSEKPRLSVYRSLKNISAQLIDDSTGRTLAAASSLEVKSKGSNKAAAETIGELIAKRAKEKGISKVVFDRGGLRYAGRVAALAGAARKAGLEF